MDEKAIRRIVQDEMDRNYRSGVPKVPPHAHNGIDGLKIFEKDIIPNKKFYTSADTTLTAGDFVIDFVPIPFITKIEFFGFAANNADGNPATLRSHINGTATFGDIGYIRSLSNQVSITKPKINGKSVNFFQVSNYAYLGTTANSFRVGDSSEYFVYATNGTSAVAIAQIQSWDDNVIRGSVALDTNWKITGTFIIS